MGKILVIDDDRTVRALLKMILKKDGHEVIECSQGFDGLKEANSIDPDLVLLDLMLPDINGLQLLEKLKESEKTSNIPVVVLTSSTDEESKLTALRRGAVDFISKPFMSEEVHLRTNTQLKLHNLIRSLKDAVGKLESDVVAASRIQMALVPSVAPEKLNMKWIYKPSSKVGGDIFDAVSLGSGKYLVYLADVSGHGVNAAMLSVMVHRFIEDYKNNILNQKLPFSIDDFMKKLEMNFQFEKFNLFFTMITMVIDTINSRIDISNAGHPLPIMVSGKDCAFVDTPVEGIVGLGLVEGSHRELSVKEGDRIFIYTDGIIEAKNTDNVPFGTVKLKEALTCSANKQLETTINETYKELIKFNESDSFEDDISLIGLEFKTSFLE